MNDAIETLRISANAIAPRAPKNVLNAALAQMRVLAEELRPTHLRAYGPLDEEVVEGINVDVQRLVDAIVGLYPVS